MKDRLLAKAHASQEEFERTLTRFAAERVLYRLGESPVRNICLLKGASLLTAWLPDPYRATRDIDLLASGSDDDATIKKIIEQICAIPCPEDGLSFDLSKLSIEAILPDEEYSGKRARFLAHLGRARINLQIDFGFGDAVVGEPQDIEYPTILSVLPSPRLRAYPREASVSEKFEAMVKLDMRNSRMKDFHDVWAISSMFAFEGARLKAAVAACFERRGTPWSMESPRCLTSGFYQAPELELRWRSYLQAGAVLVAPPTEFGQIGERIISFLDPVRQSIMEKVSFDAEWTGKGPWRFNAQIREPAA